jgi:hypothetical protein
MANQNQICNLALDMVGAEPIVDISDANPRAEACNRNYDIALLQVMRSRQWGFLTKRVSLVAATAPPFGWDVAYTLPVDYVGILQLNGIVYEGQPGDWFAINSGQLLTDEDVADIVYIGSDAQPEVFDALFVPAFATLLASRIAPALRQDGGSSSAQLLQLYRQSLSEAGTRNANEQKAPYRMPAADSMFVRSRWLQGRR